MTSPINQTRIKKRSVWCLEKERKSVIELGQLIEYQITKFFMEKVSRKCTSKANPRTLFNKASSRTLLNFGKLPKTANACK